MAQVLQHRQAALIAGIQATGTGGHLLADLAVERMRSTIAGHSVGHSAAGRNANTQLTSNPDHSQGADQVWTLAGAPPAQAQVMKPNGMALPGFLFPAAERRAREACIEERPECRASVRAQIHQEMAYSLLIPWAALGAAILWVLFRMRAKEKEKERIRLASRARHEPGKFRKLDAEKDERVKKSDDEEELD